MITAKFGGTSLCDASHFQTVREILSRREDRRFFYLPPSNLGPFAI